MEGRGTVDPWSDPPSEKISSILHTVNGENKILLEAILSVISLILRLLPSISQPMVVAGGVSF